MDATEVPPEVANNRDTDTNSDAPDDAPEAPEAMDFDVPVPQDPPTNTNRRVPPKRRKGKLAAKRKSSRYTAEDKIAFTQLQALNASVKESAKQVQESLQAKRKAASVNDNWKKARTIDSQGKKMKEIVTNNNELGKKNTTLQQELRQTKHDNYQEKKTHRAQLLSQAQELESHYEHLQQLVMEANMNTIAAQEDRIRQEQKSKAAIRKERADYSKQLSASKRKLEMGLEGEEAVRLQMQDQHQREVKRWEKKVKEKEDEVMRERIRSEQRMEIANEQLEKVKSKLMDEKSRRRHDVAKEVEKRKSVESKLKSQLEDMDDWLNEMAEEVKEAKRETRKAMKGKERVDSLANKRLIMLKDIKTRLAETRDNLADESNQRATLERLQTIGMQIKKERAVGRRGGLRWPVHIVLLICELLVNGTPPSAIPANLQSTSAAFRGCEAEELPSINFVRQCRVVVQNLNETLSAMRLGRADVWHQLFTDGTSRRQIAFQDLIIALMEDKVLDPVIVSSCIVLENETSEQQLNGILTQLDTLKHRLNRWREVTEREFPDRPDLLALIPFADSIDIDKLGNDGVVTTDTCNSTRKLRRILVEYVGGTTHQMDCMHHLRNVIVNGASKAVSSFLSTYLEDSLDEISSFLRVSPDLAHVIHAYHKEFSLTANYPKGHGEMFREWVMKNYPEEYLMHAERSNGGRQDTICMGAGPIYKNRPVNIHFLDDRLRVKDNSNILQQNLFIILSSLEMIATSRFFAILHIAVCIPFRWLAGKTHELAHQEWGARSMGRVFDIMHTAFYEILDDLDLIHDKSFMLGMFDELAKELPEFEAFMTHTLEDQRTEFVAKSGSKATTWKMLVDELFSPQDEDNKKSTDMLKKVAAIAIQAMIDEMEDETKATYKYLSISESEYSYDHCPDDVKKAMLGKHATNDLAESSFAGVTHQVQLYGTIGMHAAAGVSDAGRNGFLFRPTTKKDIAENKRGYLFGLPEELRITCVMTAIEDAPETRTSNTASLEKQREVKRLKEEAARQKGLEDAEDEYIEAVILHSMYDSAACWKTVKDVTAGLKSMKFKYQKVDALKENIMIRTKGFGGEWFDKFHINWSKGGVTLTIADLSRHLKYVINQSKKMDVPDKPMMELPVRKATAILGQLTQQVQNLDKQSTEDTAAMDARARERLKEWEESGKTSIHSEMQSRVAPEVDDAFVGKRIEYLSNYEILNEEKPPKVIGHELRWCSGEVKRVSDGTWLLPNARTRCYPKGGAADIEWDAMPDVGVTTKTKSIECLNSKLWNKQSDGAWRMDLGAIDYGT